jgi:hypothetical protein
LFAQILDQPITSCVVHEPWAHPLNVDMCKLGIRPSVFGALTFKFGNGLCLSLYARPRFGHRADCPHQQAQLMLSILDTTAWGLMSESWLKRSSVWRLHLPSIQTLKTLPGDERQELGSPEKPWRISDIQWQGNSALVKLLGASQSIRFDYRKDYDCAIVMNADELPPLTDIQNFSPKHEFAWLHPFTEIPVTLVGIQLRSFRFEHWPLSLRKYVGIPHRHEECLRTTEQVLANPTYRRIYLDKLKQLMQYRFSQYPWLNQRLAGFDSSRLRDELLFERDSQISNAAPFSLE